MIYAKGRVSRKKASALLERVGLADRTNHLANEQTGS